MTARLSEGAQNRLRREHLGLSRPKLAVLIGIDPATLWRWETGSVAPHALLRKEWNRRLRELEARRDPN
jgi:transcriptional regulator with XRE-family HTH domain